MPTADEPVKCRSISFSLPEPLIEDLLKQAKTEAKGKRPNRSSIALRALQADLKRLKTKS